MGNGKCTRIKSGSALEEHQFTESGEEKYYDNMYLFGTIPLLIN